MNDHQKLWRLFRLLRILSQPPYRTVKQLASMLECSTKTVYRYLSFLEEVGYQIDKKSDDRYFMHMEVPKELQSLVDVEEAGYLQDLLWQTPAGHPLRDRLLHKLNEQYLLRPLVQSLHNFRAYDHIKLLSEAIERGIQVQVENYFSAESGLRTRCVEPVEFLQEYTYVWVFDLDKADYRQLKVERIGSITLLEHKATKKHLSRATDLFGWTGDELKNVKLKLSRLAHRLLLEEFPESRPYMHTEEQQWFFDGYARDWRGIGRFILGLPGEIEVLEPTALRDYLRVRASKANW